MSKAEKPAWVGDGPPVNPSPRVSPHSGVAPPVEYQFRPGNKSKGGRPPGASVLTPMLRDLAEGAQFDEAGELVRAGHGAEELAKKLIAAAREGNKQAVDAILAVMERTDGPIVKEIKSDTTLTVEGGIELFDRRASAKDLPR